MKPTTIIYNDVGRVIEALCSQQQFAVDTETNGLNAYKDNSLVGISFYFPDFDEAHYLAFRHGQGDNLPDIDLKRLIEAWNAAIECDAEVIYFNALFDLHMMTKEGFAVPKYAIEVLVAAKLLNENEHYSNNDQKSGAYKLKRLAPKYLGEWAGEGETDLIHKAKEQGLNPKSEMWRLDGADVAYYAAMDTLITYKLHEFYMPHIKRWNLYNLWCDENDFLLKFLFRMERNGIRVDVGTMQELHEKEQGTLHSIQATIDEWLESRNLKFDSAKTNRRINLASPKQVSQLLEVAGLDLVSTGVDHVNRAYNDLQAEGVQDDRVTMLELLKQYREAETPIKLYYNKYPDYIDFQGFMHPNHFIGGARTGRLTCSSPNSQQFSKKGDFKKIFVPRDADHMLVSVDLSQAELRVAAHYCQEKTMLHLMQTGQDMHQYTADALSDRLNRPISRQLGKMANFGLLYRMSPPKAAIKFGIDLDLAEAIVYGWRELYGNFELGYYSALDIATRWRDVNGKLAEPFGRESYQYFRLPYDERIRHFDEAERIRKWKEQTKQWDVLKGQRYMSYGEYKTATENMVLFPYSENYKAFNFMIQGTIQAVMRKGILQLMDEFDNDHVKPIMTVYDSVVFDVRKDYVKQLADRAREVMYFPEFTIPLTVDVEAGYNYKELSGV